jgi:hypothetical protein
MKICSERISNHHQLINVTTVGSQAFLMDHISRTSNPPRGPSADWWVITTANAAGTNGLPKHGEVRDNNFFVTHPMTDQRSLAYVIARRAH